MYGWKGLDTRKAHVKYERHMSNCLTVIDKVKVLSHRHIDKKTNKGQGKKYMPLNHRLLLHTKGKDI